MALMGFLLGSVALAAYRDSHEGRWILRDRKQRRPSAVAYAVVERSGVRSISSVC